MTLRDRLASGPWTLALSAGYFGFYAHCGVISVLEEEGLIPSSLSGASAGALVAGFWAAGLPAAEIAERLLQLTKADFWDPAPGPGLIRGRRFAALLHEALPVRTFAECRIPLRISVFDMLTLRTRVLTRGALEPAIRASCAVPLMFHPVWPRSRPSVDGGVLDRCALHGIENDQPVLCHYLIPHGSSPRNAESLPHSEGHMLLALSALPRCGPNRLHFGVAAYHRARRDMRRALDRPAADRMLLTR